MAMDSVPVITGKALIVTTAVSSQPLESLYVMVAEPPETPVTRPVMLTVATASSEELQGVVPSGVPLPVNCVVLFTQADSVPVIVGSALIVTSAVCWQPCAVRVGGDRVRSA